MIFYENVWKSGELSTGWGLEVRPQEVYVKDNSDNFTPEGEDNLDNLKGELYTRWHLILLALWAEI